jgi:hypothetical protein
MATIAATQDMKRDVEELANIAIEDKTSTSAIQKYYEMSHQKLKGSLEDALEYDLAVSDITGIKIMSDRFSDKRLFQNTKIIKNEN